MATKDRRLELNELLKALTPNVYYQPPASVKMKYPAIRYELYRIDVTSANNKPYLNDRAYQVMVIDTDPDSEIVEELSKWPCTRFNRSYTADNLYHFVFIIYY
jgi:hypothetical protein